MGSMSNKGSTSGMSEEFYDWLAAVAGEVYEDISPLRRDLIGQMESALEGDVSGGMIPILSKAVESSKQAASRTQQATTEELSRTGLTGTPFGAAVLGQTKQQGEQAGATAETNILQQLISAIPDYTLGLGQTATVPGVGGAGTGKSGGGTSGTVALQI